MFQDPAPLPNHSAAGTPPHADPPMSPTPEANGDNEQRQRALATLTENLRGGFPALFSGNLPADIEDAVHNWFARVAANPPASPIQDLLACLRAVIRRAGIDRHRRHVGEAKTAAVYVAIKHANSHTVRIGRCTEWASSEKLHDALACLPADQKRALEYVYFEGYSEREAARLLGTPISTFRERLAQARDRLRHLLRESAEK